jgi:hypothetical protein
MITGALHLPSPGMPPGTTQQSLFIGSIFGTLLLAIGLAPLAARLGGSTLARAAALFVMIYIAIAVNTMIEAKVFSTWLTVSLPVICLHYVLPCLSLALTLVLTFRSAGEPRNFLHMGAMQWGWRLVVAWLSFPVIYVVFGMCVAPFVTQAYLAGIAGLALPPMTIILRTQLLRSALFLASSLPVVALWHGSRRSLILYFGFAEAMMVGIHALAQAYWLPTTLRVMHSIEITCDSFAYIAVLVLLFAKKERETVSLPATATAVA